MVLFQVSEILKLVGGLEHGFYFSIIYGNSNSLLTNLYFSEGLTPPSRINKQTMATSTIWLFNIAMENHHFLWVNLNKWAISHGYVK